MAYDATALQEFVRAAAEEHGVPGAAVGVLVGGREVFVGHGVTSVENPLPVDGRTLFVIGSVTKSFTATALLRLVADGLVDLDAPVRRYVPELCLADERTAATITVRRLLNHTAGLGVRLIVETGDGDDALAGYVARLPELELIGRPGDRASYSQAGYNLLGRVIEQVTGRSYERAVAELLLGPLELSGTVFTAEDALTRRFAVGHNADADGVPVVARQWKDTRGNNPGGGAVSCAADLLRWARFHLDGDAAVLPDDTRQSMQRQTVALRGSTLGDAFGLCWFLREIDGVATFGHGGSANGQFAELLMVPEHGFAVAVLANGGPGGVAFNRAVLRWTLEHHLGVVDRDPEPLPYDPARAADLLGDYDTDSMTLAVRADDTGLELEVLIKPELRAASAKELPADYPPFPFALLPGRDDDYLITAGAFQGQRGFFTRDPATGAVTGIDLAGRLFLRRPHGN
ncbi:serine hydrolase domain-containing protein [Kitasatospora sp. NPDC049285]|uniref:serine hydrolase domain-containing protein n=1 Tax=Kitasatospora sp. NPDC049285 TaxID=3157096 RepID=UPI003444272E